MLLLQESAPLTATAFSANGDGLIVANASNHIGVYNVEAMAATDWTRTVGAKLPARLLDMPGSIASIAVHPKVGIKPITSSWIRAIGLMLISHLLGLYL